MSLRIGVTFGKNSKQGPYLDALRLAGAEPLPLLPGDTPDGLKGLLLSGGTDVDPARYGQTRDASVPSIDPARDEFEAALVVRALQDGLPVLAICRGMQLLNVALGGTLIQHLGDGNIHRRIPDEPAGNHSAVHDAAIMPGSRLAAALGVERLAVNSRHHQAVDRPGDGLVVTARSDDGIPEGMELPDYRFVVGVQWHPEDRVHVSPPDLALFRAFLDVAM